MFDEEFEVTNLSKSLEKMFSKEELEELARDSRFICRITSRLTGQSFVMLNVLDCTNGRENSLNDSCDWLAEHFGISITKQSLDERYNTDAVRFMKCCFHKTLQKLNKEVLKKDLDIGLSKIQLVDSTSFKIPDHLAVFYKGCRGTGGKSILKMHFNYDFRSGEIEDILLTDGAANDSKYKFGTNEEITPKCLYMRDLGYYELSCFDKIDKSNAYFLSRGKTDAVCSIKNEKGKYERIDLLDYLPKKGQTKELIDIYLGSKKKIKVRLVLEAVPEEVAEKRLKRLEDCAARSKYPVSQQRKQMRYFNMFITNIPPHIVPMETIRMLYTIRWQIELMFKIWKSIFNIEKVKKMSIFRFECYIYSKLIAILLTLNIHNQLDYSLFNESSIELSPYKLAKLVKKRFSSLTQALLDGNLYEWCRKTVALILKRAQKNIRKLKGQPPKPSAWQIINLLA